MALTSGNAGRHLRLLLRYRDGNAALVPPCTLSLKLIYTIQFSPNGVDVCLTRLNHFETRIILADSRLMNGGEDEMTT